MKKETKNKKVQKAADDLIKVIKKAVVSEKHGPEKPGSNGISIYFPCSEIYKADWGGAESYTYFANRFARQTLWDDFLLFHYTNTPFEPVKDIIEKPEEEEIAIPKEDEEIIAPGKGDITMAPVKLSAEEIYYDETVLMTTQIKGTNIAYIYLFAGYYDEESDSILIADMDYIESDETKEIFGVYFPDWDSEKEFELEFEWEPILFFLDDGKNLEFCLLNPVDYGRSADDALYSVDGIYTFKGSREKRYAVIYFDNDGKIIEIYGYTNDDGTGGIYEIRPKKGDKFTILETWIEFGEEDEDIFYVEEEGGTLTFGKAGIEWFDEDAYPGEYVLGFIIEDMDGNWVEGYGSVYLVDDGY